VKSAEKGGLHRAARLRCGQEDQGQEVHAIVHPADVQDRDGGIWLLATLFGQFAFLAKRFADSAHAGSIFHTALAKVLPNLKTEIVRRSDRAKGFVPFRERFRRSSSRPR
jgi:putative transposase